MRPELLACLFACVRVRLQWWVVVGVVHSARVSCRGSPRRVRAPCANMREHYSPAGGGRVALEPWYMLPAQRTVGCGWKDALLPHLGTLQTFECQGCTHKTFLAPNEVRR